MPGSAVSERKAASEVVQGFSTTSDKIRALAKADYGRTEIAKLLGIRYQHVRNVLLRSGIDGALKGTVAVELEPVEIEVSVEPPASASAQVLLDGGFVYASEWKQMGAEGIELTSALPKQPGVYAFVIDDAIRYVGITQRTFHERMDGYRRGYARHRTSSRVKKLIRAMLNEGRAVHIITASPKEARDWNGLPVDTAAGLEIGLIRLIQPEWNMLGIKVAAKTKNRTSLSGS